MKIFVLSVAGDCEGRSTRTMKFVDRSVAVKVGESGYNNSGICYKGPYMEDKDFRIHEEDIPVTMEEFLGNLKNPEIETFFPAEKAAMDIIRRNALSKLSDAEKKALGLK